MSNTDLLDVDSTDVDAGEDGALSNAADQVRAGMEPAPVYRIYEGSRIAISSSVGKLWQRRINAAVRAYEQVAIVWDEVFKYYNKPSVVDLPCPKFVVVPECGRGGGEKGL